MAAGLAMGADPATLALHDDDVNTLVARFVVRDAQRGLRNDIRILERKIQQYARREDPRPGASIANGERLLERMREFLRYTERRVPPGKMPIQNPWLQ